MRARRPIGGLALLAAFLLGASEPECNPTPPAVEACYPGAGGGDVCLALVDSQATWGPDYAYPDPAGSPLPSQYPAPARFLELAAHDPGAALAPNFTLGELMQEWKGPYALFQPHALAHLQNVRDASGGALTVNSGYRSPAYNASVDGATYSRHMYGDAADVASGAVSLQQLADLCTAEGAGYVSLYVAHVHCDWRFDALDPAFYDAAGASALDHVYAEPAIDAELVRDGDVWTAPAGGFDEGEPLRTWTAHDAEGAVVATGIGAEFVAPAGTAEVEVVVGGRITVRADVDDR